MSGPETASTLIFDNLDIDLIYKVSSHTLFSPFFTFFVPLIYKGLRAPWTAPTVYISTTWFLFVTAIWVFQTLSNRWRNSGIRGRLDWGEQIVLITGGSSGVGALLANTLAVQHVTVVVLDLKPIETDNHNITYYKCDVSNAEEVNTVAKQIREEIGEPTVIVNNAGVIQGKSIVELKNEDVLQTVGVNLVAHFNILRTFLPAIVEEKRGHIITVSSVMGLVSAAKAADYCATKAAAISLHETLRYELDSIYNAPLVRTTLVTPGHIMTPMMAGLKPLSQGSPLPKALHNFLMPPLQPHTVVKAIIAAMDDQESRDIALPLYTQTAWFARSFPYFIRDTVQKLTGADYAMNGFRKTTGLRSEEIVKS